MASPYPMPVGDITKDGYLYRQVKAVDFNTNVTLGSFPGPYNNDIYVYPDGYPDTAGKNGPSRYYPSKVVSVHDGVCDIWFHTESINGVLRPLSAALLPKNIGGFGVNGNRIYSAKYTVCFYVDSVAGYKLANLFYPIANWFYNGEFDFPEGDFNHHVSVFMHRQNGTGPSDQDSITLANNMAGSWMVADIEWISGTRFTCSLNGVVVFEKTARVPNTAMFPVFQQERSLSTTPTTSASGHLLLDWFTFYSVEVAPEDPEDPPEDPPEDIPPDPPEPEAPPIPVSIAMSSSFVVGVALSDTSIINITITDEPND